MTEPTVPATGDADCLAIDELVAMLEGTLPAERSDAVLGHIDRCATCAEVIANLGSLDGPARRIGRYQIERVLGAGGMGIVYLAFDPELQRHVAIKLVRPDSTTEGAPRLILKEARTLAKLGHPNVVAVYDVGEHEGEVFLASEYIDGMTLADWQIGRSHDDIVGAWIQVAHGLAAAHAIGVVHRDVKPANVFVGRDGRVRIGDFGIARRAATAPAAGGEADAAAGSATLMLANAVAGTPAYMAPEQRSGRLDARSDQFSACVALAEALTGARPSAGDAVAIEPPALAAALSRGISFDPDARFPSMTELAGALEAAIAPPVKSRRVAIAAIVAGAAAVVVVGLAFALRKTPETCVVEDIGVWSKPRAQKLAKALGDDATPAIDRWVQQWSEAAADVCATTDSTLRERRHRCLDAQRDQLAQMIDGWEAKPGREAVMLYDDIDNLPHPSWCSRTAVLATPEVQLAQVMPIAAIRAELAVMTPQTPRADLDKLIARSRAIGFTPLTRDIVTTVAQLRAETDRPGTVALLRANLDDGPHDISEVNVILSMIPLLDPTQIGDAEQLASRGRATIAALGGDAQFEGFLDFVLHRAEQGAGRKAESLAAAERSHQNLRNAFGPGSPEEAFGLASLAGAYFQRDGLTSPQGIEAGTRADEIYRSHHIHNPGNVPDQSPTAAVERFERAMPETIEKYGKDSYEVLDIEHGLITAYENAGDIAKSMASARHVIAIGKALKRRDAHSAFAASTLARELGELGRAREALPIAREAVALAEQLKLDEELRTARSSLAGVLVRLDKLDEARPLLEQAMEQANRTNEIARRRATIRFALAQSLAKKDPRRAVDQARIALAESESFAATPEADPKQNPVGAASLRHDMETLQRDIHAWLRVHDRRQ